MCRSIVIFSLLSLALGKEVAVGSLRGNREVVPGGGGFLSRQASVADVTTVEVETSLVSELASNVSSQRLAELEEALKPMYTALPKGEAGYLGHQAVRYALHRLLLQRHGWFVVGLEPTTEALPPYLSGEWVPEYLQGLLEQRLGSRGINLKEIAALAASLEDLVAAEAARRLDLIYDLLKVQPRSRLDKKASDRVLETYMMMYLDDGNFSTPQHDLDLERQVFKTQYANWDAAANWMEHIKEEQLVKSTDGKLGHDEMVSIAGELGKHFGAFNDGECHSLKQEMLTMESAKPGRVSLLEFYKKGLYSHWEFNEKADYLRAIGALDETGARPLVILPNYLAARTNCLTASKLYSVCCRNECEDLMGHIEQQIAGPTASPERVLELVNNLVSDTTNASRVLPGNLVKRLHEIASRHGGEVPLHGRLFAQWMHHAYPRECPFPHEGGKNPLTPDEWMVEAGEGEARVTEAEVRKMVGECSAGGPCQLGRLSPATPASSLRGNTEEEADPDELPWSDVEVMLTTGQQPVKDHHARMVILKLCLLLVLLPFVKFYLGSQPTKEKSASSKLADPEFEFPEPMKPGQELNKMQVLKVMSGLVVVGLLLEVVGILDHFSFACTLVGGLLLNVVPHAIRLLAPPPTKPGKLV